MNLRKCSNATLLAKAREKYPKGKLALPLRDISCVKYHKEPGARRSGLFQDRSPAPADINSFCFPQARPFSAQAPDVGGTRHPQAMAFDIGNDFVPRKPQGIFAGPAPGFGREPKSSVWYSLFLQLLYDASTMSKTILASGARYLYRFPQKISQAYIGQMVKTSSGISVRPGHVGTFWAPGCCLARCSRGEGPGRRARYSPRADGLLRKIRPVEIVKAFASSQSRLMPLPQPASKSGPAPQAFGKARRRPRKHAGAGALQRIA